MSSLILTIACKVDVTILTLQMRFWKVKWLVQDDTTVLQGNWNWDHGFCFWNLQSYSLKKGHTTQLMTLINECIDLNSKLSLIIWINSIQNYISILRYNDWITLNNLFMPYVWRSSISSLSFGKQTRNSLLFFSYAQSLKTLLENVELFFTMKFCLSVLPLCLNSQRIHVNHIWIFILKSLLP